VTDQFEHELRDMLWARASDISPAGTVPAGLIGRVAHRRTMKLIVGTGVAVIAVGAVAAGAITATATDKHPRVIASNTTTIAPPPTSVATPTTKATTTTAPAAVPAIASFGCPTTSVSGPDTAGPTVATRTIPGLDPSLVNRVRSYVGPRAADRSNAGTLEPDVVLGPNGWVCRVFRSNGGGAVMYVYPPAAQDSFQSGGAWTTSGSYSGPEVRVETAVLGHDPDISLACPVFANDPIVQQWLQQLAGS
jgi:hypothetical protein